MLIASFIAGIFAVLSPCVLPVLPLLFSSSATADRYGPLKLLAGFNLSFLIAAILVDFGLSFFSPSPELFRHLGAYLLIAMGILSLFPKLWNWLAEKTTNPLVNKFSKGGRSEFSQGMLLGLIWSPCIGPNLGAALGMLAVADVRLRGLLFLMAFAFGATTVLATVLLLLRRRLYRLKTELLAFASWGRLILASCYIVLGVLVLFNGDKILIGRLTEVLPDSWIAVLSKF